MKKNKIFISVLLCLCLYACTKKAAKVERGGYDLIYKTGYYASEINKDKDALYVIYSHKGIGDDTKWGGEDDDIIPNKYATDNDLQGRYLDTSRDENGNPLGFNLKTTELDKFNVDIYDIKTGEKLKTIDVKNIFDNDDNIKPDRPYKAMALEYDGKPYIMVWSEKTSKDIENGYEDKLKSVFINIEDETYFEELKNEILKEIKETLDIESYSFLLNQKFIDFIPETEDKILEELDEIFQKKDDDNKDLNMDTLVNLISKQENILDFLLVSGLNNRLPISFIEKLKKIVDI